MGHGKKYAWATWNSFPQLTDSFLTLTTTPVSIQVDTMHCIERCYSMTEPVHTWTSRPERNSSPRGTPSRASHQPIFLGTAYEEISLPGWLCLGAGLGPLAHASITNKLGLAANNGWILRTALDNTP
ncbi:hypothetical protein Pcinc_008304 [Petrolisthes cinctipes]|uniref:Uncharacterized protein n=1 Tax=Petrolisthes cinctipes TaxID=88211 RepID=A0AAE1G998_PETCI|nr:hypothetical protein Pcinc_008304 [Petrolisthes cinctipes]